MNLPRIKDILKEWVLPPRVHRFLLELKLKKIKTFKKNWQYEPLVSGIHDLPCFREADLSPCWLSMNKEARPGIILNKSLNFSFAASDSADGIMQIGFGVPSFSDIETVKTFLNHRLAAAITKPTQGLWHDVRIPIKAQGTKIDLAIDYRGRGEIYVSHPFISQEANLSAAPRPSNIICIIVDGLIFDFVEDKALTPNINSFFKDGISCHNVYAQGDWTLPAFSSMLTGLYPSRHRVNNPDAFDSALPESVVTLPQLLQARGFRTFGHSGHVRFSPAYGHAKGFERFIFRPLNYHLLDNYPRAIYEAVMHLEAHKQESNFVFLHLFDTHEPYQPTGYLNNVMMPPMRPCQIYARSKGDRYDQFADALMDKFKAKVYEVDCALDALFAYIQKQPWYPHAHIILTADHGTCYAVKNKPLLMEKRVKVPLLVSGPGISAGKEFALIEGSVDLMPSILKLAGIVPPVDISGRVWPFLGGLCRGEAFTESLYKDTYAAVIRDDRFSYHFRYPYDESTGAINFNTKNDVVVFARQNGRDIERDVWPQMASQKEVMCERLLRYHRF